MLYPINYLVRTKKQQIVPLLIPLRKGNTLTYDYKIHSLIHPLRVATIIRLNTQSST